MRHLKALAMAMAMLAAAPAMAQFHLREVNQKSIEVTDNGAPVLTYNYGVMLKQGANPDRARCCYIYPVYAPNGAQIADDFPLDHPHHRGISWMWPIVKVDGKTYNLWAIEGIHDRFEKWKARKAGRRKAVLAVQNGWYVGERRVVQEDVEIVAHAVANGRRDLDITVTLRPVGGAQVEIGGTHEHNKGYGGALEVRFAARAGTRIRTSTQDDAADSDRLPAAWAELTGNFSGKVATTRVTEDPANPGAPNGWCLRHYGYVGVEYPALELRKLDSKKPLVMKFRVSLWGGSPGASLPRKNILVYTRNGKGYVHKNIPFCVAAIKKMGAENGFGVDVSASPNFFRDDVLKQYQAVVFANTNNEAFTKDFQRKAFKHYIESGGGFVGIHSASGSERHWPYFQAVLGGKFVRHPHQQTFLVRVEDRNFPATRQLPATFEWRDECYLLGNLNPDIHVLLTTDYDKLDDPGRAKHPEESFSGTIPLAWYHHFDGGREYYIALGHNKEEYQNPLLYNQILGGILWAMGGK